MAFATDALLGRSSAPPIARQFRVLAVLSTILFALALLWGMIDERTVNGVVVWAKPAKFAGSFILYFATMALVAERLSPKVQSGWAMRVIVLVSITAYVGEMGYMFIQAAQAEPSHFNFSTPFHRLAYTLMGVGAVSLIATVALLGIVAALDKEANLGPGLRAGVLWGFVATFVLTFIVAGYLGGNGSAFVGTPGPDAAVLPIVGWSMEVGDLRPAHFLSIHAMQVLPLIGFALDRSNRKPGLVVPVATAAYAALTFALFAQALMGLPLIAA